MNNATTNRIEDSMETRVTREQVESFRLEVTPEYRNLLSDTAIVEMILCNRQNEEARTDGMPYYNYKTQKWSN